MRPDDSRQQEQSIELPDLPARNEVDASKDAAKIKGGADVISPRDPASGLPTGKRL